jgi:hypothetical protein
MDYLISADHIRVGSVIMFLNRRWQVTMAGPVEKPPNKLGLSLVPWGERQQTESGVVAMIIVVEPNKLFGVFP